MTLLSWSGGKDAALTLHALGPAGVDALVTTVTQPFDRVTMHGVRRALLEEQVARIGLPLEVVELAPDPSNEEYERAMVSALNDLASRVPDRRIAFGDIFLEDVRGYREAMLEPTELEAIFPLWGKETHALYRELLEIGVRAIVVCVDTEQISREFLGRTLDQGFFDDLPAGRDPCGENGEYHTFVFDGPMFSEPVPIVPGRIEERGRFHFLDLAIGAD